MIKKVWGIVNGQEITFTPVKDKPDYWEGYADRQEGLQDIEIWAENEHGARGHLKCSVAISWYTDTQAKIILCPYFVEMVTSYSVSLFDRSDCCCCRR